MIARRKKKDWTCRNNRNDDASTRVFVESAEFRRRGGHFHFGTSVAEISHTADGPITEQGSTYTNIANRRRSEELETIAMSLRAGGVGPAAEEPHLCSDRIAER